MVGNLLHVGVGTGSGYRAPALGRHTTMLHSVYYSLRLHMRSPPRAKSVKLPGCDVRLTLLVLTCRKRFCP